MYSATVRLSRDAASVSSGQPRWAAIAAAVTPRACAVATAVCA